MSEVGLIGDECINTLDQVVIALGHLFDMSSAIVPRDVFDVEDF